MKNGGIEKNMRRENERKEGEYLFSNQEEGEHKKREKTSKCFGGGGVNGGEIGLR